MRKKTSFKAATVSRLLWRSLKQRLQRSKAPFDYVQPPALPGHLTGSRSPVFIRHLDCGSCNGCELELNALMNPVYDLEQYGIRFEASPRHAPDWIAMTGPYTRNLDEAARLTIAATPGARILAVGDCAIDGGIFRESYAVMERPSVIESAVVLKVAGCPPPPVAVLQILLEHR
jgi:Ni,Fe-hydrogenase III small subunit